MKKKAIITGLGLVFCGLMTARAQEKVVQPTADSGEAKIISMNPGAAAVDYDTKLYANREEALLAEKTSNPEKPTTPDFDAKPLDEGMSSKDNIPSPSRPTTPETDPKLNAGTEHSIIVEKTPEVNLSQPGNTSADIDANTGQAKVKTEGSIFNYREINGPSSQEIPAPQGKIINYREIKGPDDQPREKQPAR